MAQIANLLTKGQASSIPLKIMSQGKLQYSMIPFGTIKFEPRRVHPRT